MIDLAAHYAWANDLNLAAPMGIPTHRIVRREAVGVVAAITPWNFPNQINLAKIGPGAGRRQHGRAQACARHALDRRRAGRLAAEHTDLPPGVFNVITSAATRSARC